MIQAIVFDLDDTLYAERDYVMSGFEAVSAWLSASLGGPAIAARAKELFDAGERATLFNRCLDEAGFVYEPELISDLVRVYRHHTPRLNLFEDAAWILDELSSCRLGVITDGYLAGQQQKVRALGIAERFEAIVFSDALGRDSWKPSEAPFRSMMDSLSLPGNACVYIGDNVRKDFVGCKGLGWRTVHVDRGDGEYSGAEVPETHHAEVRTRSLYNVPAVLAGLDVRSRGR